MRRYAYNWIWLAVITIITAAVCYMCITDIMTATDPAGLRIVSKVADGDRTYYTLDCGVTMLQFSAMDYTTLKVGDYIPVFDEFRSQVNASIAAASIFMGVVLLFFLGELFRVPDIIRKILAKQGMFLNGEVKSFEHYILGFYIVKVECDGATFKMRYPLTKHECKKYPIGTPAVVWNGGRKRQWVELRKPQ